jgi:putative PD-(D/E)XK family protein DUF4420
LEVLSWEVFERYLHILSPTILNMGGNKGVQVGFNPTTRNLFLRIPIDPNSSVPPSPYSELKVEISETDSGSFLEISTMAEHLYREFHKFAGIVTEDFELPGQTALGAFESAIRRWLELTSRIQLLSDEQQLGLQGELTFLHALIKTQGTQAVVAWTGRDPHLPERHDFRLGNVDIEVKATRGSRRQHIIHGLEQLQPSKGHTLYLLSLRFEGAGLNAGKSLYDEIQSIRRSLGNASTERSEFENRLLLTGYFDKDAEHYHDKLIFADDPVLAIVDERLPKITKNILESALQPEIAGRIGDVSYRIDIDGIGARQGSELFSQVLGKLKLEVK